jgi:transposase-like protein
METKQSVPKTLADAILYFADPDRALEFMVSMRWPHGVACPHCKSKEAGFLKTRRIWKCRGCKKQFSVKVGTIFEDSALGLDKWLPAMWMIANCKNGISSYEVARALGVTQKTGWFMLHRIRLAMQSETFNLFGGDVEVDETFIGGRVPNMHRRRRPRGRGGRTVRGAVGKAIVMGIMERTRKNRLSRVRLKQIKDTGWDSLFPEIKRSVANGSNVYTDEHPSYTGLRRYFNHDVVNHAKEYVRGRVHTNSMENFWSLLKRTIRGTYVSVEPFHLFRYLDEQAFRFNHREGNDAARFVRALGSIMGRRLTYRGLTGAAAPQTC